MTEHEASRTLVKSPPELWAECSDAASLARHLGTFGEIRITRLEPETAVAWEGDDVSGTVKLQPSGWGTRVILTASEASAEEPGPEAAQEEGVAAPEGEPQAESDVGRVGDPWAEGDSLLEGESVDGTETGRPHGRFMARLRMWFGAGGSAEPSAEFEAALVAEEESAAAVPEAAVEPEAAADVGGDDAGDPVVAARDGQAALAAALDSLGQAHHRPFSRA